MPGEAVRFRPDVGVAVVVAARGYPDAPLKGTEIRRLDRVEASPGVTVFHAGTRLDEGRILADGGRVLTVTGVAPDAAEARSRAYAAIAALDWPEGFCRRDIGAPGTRSSSGA